MKPIIFISLFVLVATALPFQLSVNDGTGRLQKREDVTDSIITTVVKAAVLFGAFIFGGGIISRRAVNYYFEKLEEKEKKKSFLITGKLQNLMDQRGDRLLVSSSDVFDEENKKHPS
jgi:hypothetical protein